MRLLWCSFLCSMMPSADETELGVKSAGRLRMEGRKYEVIDGDIMHFKFNVSGSKK